MAVALQFFSFRMVSSNAATSAAEYVVFSCGVAITLVSGQKVTREWG